MQSLTKKDLEDTLEAQSKAILEAVDFSINGIKSDISELKQDISELKQDISELKQDISKLKQKASESLTQQDGIIKQLSDLQQENKMSSDLYKNHEKRIYKLEMAT